MKIEVRESLSQFFGELDDLKSKLEDVQNELEITADCISQLLDDDECNGKDMKNIFEDLEWLRSHMEDYNDAVNEITDGFAMMMSEEDV